MSRVALLIGLFVLGSGLLGCAGASPSGGDPDSPIQEGALTNEVGDAGSADALTPSLRDRWLAVAQRAGARPIAQAKKIVIGVRGITPNGQLHDTKADHVFDDTFVVITANASDSVLILPGSTHPFEHEGVSGVPDVDGDGARDVGMVRPGLYVAAQDGRSIDGAPVYGVTTMRGNGALPAWRDTNHDGMVSSAERAKSESRGDTMDAILFHVASDAAPKAVGCQVGTRETIEALAQRAGASFDYVLVNAAALNDPGIFAMSP